MTIGERIKHRREELGLSVEDIAQKLGKHRSTIYRYESDEIGNLPADVLEPLASVLQTTPAHLMGWEEKRPDYPNNILPLPKTKKVPRLGVIACGEPILAEENIEGYDEIPEEINADFTLVCKGDSMINARIMDGDIIYIRSQPDVENGEIAAVLLGDEATLKRVRKTDTQLILWPENPSYSPLVFEGEAINNVKILGKAIIFQSRIR